MGGMTGFRLCFVALVAVFMTAVGSIAPASANSKYAALVIHADTGDILFDRYSTQKRYPASLTKMMTLYMLFEKLEAGELTLESKLKVSRSAAAMPASKLGLKTGETISVEDAIHSLIVKSANDVAVVVAEEIGGSESRFARMMTDKAWDIGMRSTQFRNASGLPDSRQITTARDMATLSQRVVQDFPQFYHFFAEQEFEWDGKTIKGHNRVVKSLDGADGLKTGYTRSSGYNLATTTDRDGNRLIGIVLGGRSSYTRDAHMEKIINNAYEAIEDKPELVSAVFRNKPVPNLKPTTLAELGGEWPVTGRDGTKIRDVLALADTPTVAGSADLRNELRARAASGDWRATALPEGDDLGTLLASNDDTPAQRDDGIIGEGDIDYEAMARKRQWSIQTGAFRDMDLAESERDSARGMIADVAQAAVDEISETLSAGRRIYRIRFNGMTESEARSACKAVINSGGDCFTLRNPAASGT